MSGPVLKVAITQAEPEWLNLAEAVKKTISFIEEAAKGGAKIVAFPECWIPGYPAWIWQRPLDLVFHTRYIKNSLMLDSPEMDAIKAAASANDIAVALGFSERTDTHSLYISQALITPQGDMAMHRRKIKPTHMERTIFGDGTGPDLNNVVDIDFGEDVGILKIGTLACGEHTQPLLKFHTYTQKEVLHISMWPPTDPHGGPEDPSLWWMTAEGVHNLSRTYAIEGGAFVLHCTGVLTEKGADVMQTKDGLMFQGLGGGFSCAFAPDGRRLTEPFGEGKPTEEGIVFADLDLGRIMISKTIFDVVGHYSRPDLLWLGADNRPKEHVRHRKDANVE